MNGKIKEDRFKQNQIQLYEAGKAPARPSFSSKLTRRRKIKIGTAIFVIVILHFVSQFIFFRSENFQSGKISSETANEQNVEIKTEYEAKNLENTVTPEIVSPIVVEPASKNAPVPTVVKKKEQRESKAERLRHAERILTGA